MPFSATVHGNDLARVCATFGIEDVAQRAHRAKRGWREQRLHVRQLVQTNTVFAGDRAAGVDAGLHDLRHRGVYARRLVRVVRVVADVRVHVAVASMEDVADVHAIARADAMNFREHGGQFRSRYNGILHHEVRRDATHRAEGLLAALPEPRAVGGIGGDAHATDPAD